MAAHLAGVIAGHTTLPVIGIPCKSAALDGMDALLATVMMPSGIPVATVAIDGAKNAAILAVQMLALSDDDLAAKLEAEKQKMIDGVMAKDTALQDTAERHLMPGRPGQIKYEKGSGDILWVVFSEQFQLTTAFRTYFSERIIIHIWAQGEAV